MFDAHQQNTSNFFFIDHKSVGGNGKYGIFIELQIIRCQETSFFVLLGIYGVW